MLEKLEHQLHFMQQCAEAPSVIRTAATAGLIMVGKYYALTDDNEVYRIAMGGNLFISNPHSLSHPFLFAVMLPNKKMAQFIENPDWHTADVDAVERLAKKRFTETYDTSAPNGNAPSITTIPPPVSFVLLLRASTT